MFQYVSVFGICLVFGVASLNAAPLTFSDQALARGINYTSMNSNVLQFGAGLAMLDLDGDDDLDIVIAGQSNGMIGVYENDGAGNFTNRSFTALMSVPIASGISAADYDNDGDQDLLIGGWESNPTKLYRNDGGFVFTDVSAAAGINVVQPVMGSSWSDYDHDGDMDFYLPVRTGTNANTQSNYFFQNNGDGTFTDVAVALNVDAETDPTLLSAFFDYDRDGDDDLYLGTDKGNGGVWKNRLYRNDGGIFTEITDAANAAANIDCMGITFADLNNDSQFDIYMTDIARNQLLINDGTGVYVDQTDAAGVTSGRIGWGTVFADFDNDSFMDVYVCTTVNQNHLYRGAPIANWPMVDDGPSSGAISPFMSYSVAVGDVNNDGLLDMLVGDIGVRTKLYINQSADAVGNHHIRFKPIGDNVNENCVGACINVFAGGKWQVVQERAGVNYKAAEGRAMHLGIGTDTEASIIEAVFPGNTSRLLFGAPADRTWTIYEESRLGDPDNNGIIDPAEIAMAQAEWTGPGVKIEPGVEIFDMDGDFDIDDDDIALMSPCAPDLNGDGNLDFFDVSYFLSNSVDYNGDTTFDFFDVSGFLQAFGLGCP